MTAYDEKTCSRLATSIMKLNDEHPGATAIEFQNKINSMDKDYASHLAGFGEKVHKLLRTLPAKGHAQHVEESKKIEAKIREFARIKLGVS